MADARFIAPDHLPGFAAVARQAPDYNRWSGKPPEKSMRLTWPAIATLLIALYGNPLAAQPDDGRIKVGLVLSGGGARGGAHVGVLRALEELNVPIDYIAGTSMGAIIGGFYAAGFSAAEIEQILIGMDWNRAMSDSPDRGDRKSKPNS